MNWTEIQTRYVAALRVAAGLPSLDVRWDDAPAANGWRSDVFVRLRLRGIRGDAHERRYREVEGAPEDDHADYLEPREYGPRVLTVELVVETRTQTLALTSVALGERIRTGLRLPQARAAFDQAHVGIARVGRLREVSYPSEGDTGRMRSASVIEVEHNAASVAVGALMDYIERIEGAGDVDGRAVPIEAGAPAPPPAPPDP